MPLEEMPDHLPVARRRPAAESRAGSGVDHREGTRRQGRQGLVGPSPVRLIEREERDPAERNVSMNRANPWFIARNHLLDRAVAQAMKEADYTEIEKLRRLCENPFDLDLERLKNQGIDPEPYAADTPGRLVHKQLSCSA